MAVLEHQLALRDGMVEKMLHRLEAGKGLTC